MAYKPTASILLATAFCSFVSSVASAQTAPAQPAPQATSPSPNPATTSPTSSPGAQTAPPSAGPATPPSPPSASPTSAQPYAPGYGYPPPTYGQPGASGYAAYPPGYGYPPASQGYLQTPPGYLTHDGFFMRFNVGFGYMHNSVDGHTLDGQMIDYVLKGPSMAFAMAFGGSITPNLVLLGELMIHTTLELTAESGAYSYTTDRESLDLFSIGPGFAYYLMPRNIYFSGSLLFHQLALGDGDGSSEDDLKLSNLGVGISAMVGKEWWVSSDWGLGIAARLFFGSAKNKYNLYTTDSRWKSLTASVVFSATYN